LPGGEILVTPSPGRHGLVSGHPPARSDAQDQRRRPWLREVVVQMPETGFPVEMAGGVPVVAAPGEIDVTSADDLRTALVAAAARGHGTFVVDMSLTRFCDSSGLHALVAAHRRAQAEGGEMLLVVPDAAVLRVLAITGVDQVIPNFVSLDEALVQAPAAPPGYAGAADTLFPSPSPEATYAHAPLPDHHLRSARPSRPGSIREL
jgi:anti-anti-sigma factor